MCNPLLSLKVVIFVEWAYDPPAGLFKYYYIDWANKYDDLLWIINESYDHLSESIDSDERKYLLGVMDTKNLTANYIKKFKTCR